MAMAMALAPIELCRSAAGVRGVGVQ